MVAGTDKLDIEKKFKSAICAILTKIHTLPGIAYEDVVDVKLIADGVLRWNIDDEKIKSRLTEKAEEKAQADSISVDDAKRRLMHEYGVALGKESLLGFCKALDRTGKKLPLRHAFLDPRTLGGKSAQVWDDSAETRLPDGVRLYVQAGNLAMLVRIMNDVLKREKLDEALQIALPPDVGTDRTMTKP